MFIDILFFILVQTILFILYKTYQAKSNNFIFSNLFQSKTHFFIFNSSIFLSCLYLNIKKQIFCIPVLWTSILLVLFCISFLLLPFIDKKARIYNLLLFFSGLGIFINIYIILFARWEYLGFILINLIIIIPILIANWLFRKTSNSYSKASLFFPAFVITPYFFLAQLIIILRQSNVKQKMTFVSSSTIAVFVALALTYQVKTIFKKVELSTDYQAELLELNKNPINHFLIELILGSHWKYHTELCIEFDGWRPPFHDPILIISNKILFPYEHFGHNTKLAFNPLPYSEHINNFSIYKNIYPDNKTSFTCRCGIDERIVSGD